MKYRANITGVGGYVPDYVLTNEELSTMVETNDEWIVTRTGIKERRILKEGGTSLMIEKAILDLFEKTGTKPEEIDLIILSTVTPDQPVPTTANKVARNLGMVNAWGFDYQAACSGFLFGLEISSRMVESGKYKKCLLIGADKMSSITDYTDRNTCILFGDGAGVLLIEPTTNFEYGIIDTLNIMDGSGLDNLYLKRGGSLYPLDSETILLNEHYLYQDGKKVFIKAVKYMADAVETIMKRNNLDQNTLDWLTPHQANKRIIDAAAQRAGLNEDKVMLNIQKYGNTTNATIPLCLWEYQNKLKKGDNIVCCAFGAGYTYGASYIKWGIEN